MWTSLSLLAVPPHGRIVRPYMATRHSKMQRTAPGNNIDPWFYGVLSLLTAIGWVCIDWLRGHRDAHWVPPSLREWGGVLLVAYVLFLGLWCFAGLSRRISSHFFNRHARFCMATLWFLAAMGIGGAWIISSPDVTSRARIGFLFLPLFVGGLFCIALFLSRTRSFSRAPIPWLGAVWGGALVAGMGMSDLATRLAFLSPHRGTILLASFLSIAVPLAMTGWLLWRNGRARWLMAQSAVSLLILAAGPTVDAFPSASHARLKQPDVLMVTIDTMRANWSSVYGGPVPTPAFERMAERGTVFDHAYSLAPWTCPSMYGLLTSQYPVGISGNPEADMAETRRWYVHSATTLADQFRSAGYQTVGLVANLLLTRNGGPTSGCEHVFQLDYEERNTPQSFLHQLPLAETALSGILPLRWIDTTRILTEYALRYLRSERQRPIFLWVHYMDPHDPYDPPARYRTLTGAWPFFAPARRQYDAPPPDLDTLPEKDRAYVRSLYQGEMRYVDEGFGRLLDAIDASAQWDRTIVCVTADHGEELWDHGRWGHGHSLYNELVHVPWLIAGKGVAHQRIANPVSAIDCTPTLTALAGLPSAGEWKGVSLVPQLAEGSQFAGSPVFINATGLKTKVGVEAIVQGEFKLIRRYGEPPLALHNLAADPKEQANILPGAEDMAAPLFQQLDAWSQKIHGGEPTPATDPDVQRVQEEMQERLRSMGYLR